MECWGHLVLSSVVQMIPYIHVVVTIILDLVFNEISSRRANRLLKIVAIYMPVKKMRTYNKVVKDSTPNVRRKNVLKISPLFQLGLSWT